MPLKSNVRSFHVLKVLPEAAAAHQSVCGLRARSAPGAHVDKGVQPGHSFFAKRSPTGARGPLRTPRDGYGARTRLDQGYVGPAGRKPRAAAHWTYATAGLVLGSRESKRIQELPKPNKNRSTTDLFAQNTQHLCSEPFIIAALASCRTRLMCASNEPVANQLRHLLGHVQDAW